MRMEKATEIVLAKELFEQGVSKSAIARRLGRSRETIGLWLRGIEEHGQKAFLDQMASACRVPRPSRQVDAITKRRIWAIREREHNCCGQKIAYFLQKEHDTSLSAPKIYEVLAQKFVIGSKRKKTQIRGEAPTAHAPRQLTLHASSSRWIPSTLVAYLPSPPLILLLVKPMSFCARHSMPNTEPSFFTAFLHRLSSPPFFTAA